MRANRSKWSTVIGTMALVGIGVWPLTGCEEGALENTGEEVDEAIEDAGEAIEDAGEEIEDAADDAADGR